jgi:hypothetical protein
MLYHVALVRTEILEEHIATINRMTRTGELGTALEVTSNRSANVVPGLLILVTMMMEAIHSSEMLVLTTATWRNIPEDGILHSHCCENLISYIALTS